MKWGEGEEMERVWVRVEEGVMEKWKKMGKRGE